MVGLIYKRVWKVFKEKFWQLFGLLWLGTFLAEVGVLLGGPVLGIGICIALLLGVAVSNIFLRTYRGETSRCLHLFHFFSDWKTIKRVLCGMGWMCLWLFLWYAIPIVGIVFGTIRFYEYRLTPLILATEPDIAPTEAIRVSRQRTEGYKSKMFWADALCGAIAFVALLIPALLCSIRGAEEFFSFILLLVAVAVVLTVPVFVLLLQSAFFEEILHPTVHTEIHSDNFCTQCGSPLPKSVNFCPHCGNKTAE